MDQPDQPDPPEQPSARAALNEARRWVVKVGSRSIVGEGEGRFGSMASQIAGLREQGRSVVLVSSGAIAMGRERLGFAQRPRAIGQLQACAAAGQSLLMRGYEEALSPHQITCAQVLLTHADLADRGRYLNARAALDALLSLGALPVINENDTVAVDEIRFGDNDQLAAMVSTLVGADLLVLLTDVEGLLDREGQRVSVVERIEEAFGLVEDGLPDATALGSGGMGSKLEAVRRATRRGVPVVIGDARDPESLLRIAAGEEVGTLFLPQGARLASRKHWIAYTLRTRGALLLDAGATRAVLKGGKSLLPVGVIGVRGEFEPGEAVALIDPAGKEIARGLARYGMRDVARLAGAQTDEIGGRIGHHGGDEIVHRDDLVLL